MIFHDCAVLRSTSTSTMCGSTVSRLARRHGPSPTVQCATRSWTLRALRCRTPECGERLLNCRATTRLSTYRDRRESVVACQCRRLCLQSRALRLSRSLPIVSRASILIPRARTMPTRISARRRGPSWLLTCRGRRPRKAISSHLIFRFIIHYCVVFRKRKVVLCSHPSVDDSLNFFVSSASSAYPRAANNATTSSSFFPLM